MKHVLFGLALAAGLLVAPVQAETLAYPSADAPSFIIDHPANWEMEPGEEVGDYVTLNAPTGAVLQLRTIPGTEKAMNAAVQENVDYLGETFSDVQLGEPQELKSGKLEGSVITGSGKDEDDQDVGFAIYFIGLPDGKIAEIWYAVVKGDEAGHKAAVKILDSFRTP
jgi:hypothetical protein